METQGSLDSCEDSLDQNLWMCGRAHSNDWKIIRVKDKHCDAKWIFDYMHNYVLAPVFLNSIT